MCRKCYRNHVYCSEKCRKAGYSESHRKAQSKYQGTKKGKKIRNNGAKRRRGGKKKYTVLHRKTIQGCICLMMLLQNTKKEKEKMGKKEGECILCGKKGRVVDNFPRRTYGVSKKIQKKEPP